MRSIALWSSPKMFFNLTGTKIVTRDRGEQVNGGLRGCMCGDNIGGKKKAYMTLVDKGVHKTMCVSHIKGETT